METVERTLYLNGTIAEESWFDDDVTPQMFKDELQGGSGDITVWINSPGGDCVAAAQIYNMLHEYKGNVTVKIDGIAASAASVIAMAGSTVLMSPVSMMMIHNPATIAFGDHTDMQRAIDLLNEVKESIINAYVLKTGLSCAKLSHLMDAETWMNANKAMELGFADGVISREQNTETVASEEVTGESIVKDEGESRNPEAVLFSRRAVNNALLNKLEKHYSGEKKTVSEQAEIPATAGCSAGELRERLEKLKRLV